MSTPRPLRHDRGPPLFVYGTLLCPEIWALVVRAPAARRPAHLRDHRRGPIVGEVFPGVVPQPGARVEGALLAALPPAARARLDAYEGSLYARTPVRVHLPGGHRVAAETYLVAPSHRDLVAPGDWSLPAFRASALPAFLAALRDLAT
mgnify:CR=1 FL=1